mgnify:CR=1 FL=1
MALPSERIGKLAEEADRLAYRLADLITPEQAEAWEPHAGLCDVAPEVEHARCHLQWAVEALVKAKRNAQAGGQ